MCTCGDDPRRGTRGGAKQCFDFRGSGWVSIANSSALEEEVYTACVWMKPQGPLAHVAGGASLTFQTVLAMGNGLFESAVTQHGELCCVVNADISQTSERGSLGSIYASASSKNLRQSLGGISAQGRSPLAKRTRARYGAWCRTGIRLWKGAWAHVAWAVNESAVVLYVDGIKRSVFISFSVSSSSLWRLFYRWSSPVAPRANKMGGSNRYSSGKFRFVFVLVATMRLAHSLFDILLVQN
jgi:hypothetical protein